MATLSSFEELECWQESRKLVNLIYGQLRTPAFKKDFDLVGQVRRSAVSVMANIAEGFHRNSTKDFLKFLSYSRASLAETLSHYYVALDQGYIQKEQFAEMKGSTEIVGKKINALIRYLNNVERR